MLYKKAGWKRIRRHKKVLWIKKFSNSRKTVCFKIFAEKVTRRSCKNFVRNWNASCEINWVFFLCDFFKLELLVKSDLLVFIYYTTFKMIFRLANKAAWQWYFIFFFYGQRWTLKFCFFMFCVDLPRFYLELLSFSWS